MIGHSFQYPAQIVAIVRRQTQFRAVGHDLGQAVEHLVRHKAALVMPAFRPRIRKQDKHALSRRRRQSLDQQTRIAGKDTNVSEMASLEAREQFDYSVLKDLAADYASLGMSFRLYRQMFTRTKTDLKPDPSSLGAE
jgi:hypothetical protein